MTVVQYISIEAQKYTISNRVEKLTLMDEGSGGGPFSCHTTSNKIAWSTG